MTGMRLAAAATVVHLLLVLPGVGETYQVGPAEIYATVSQVSGRLVPGDCVEVTGDITDTVLLFRHGTSDRPISIRGRCHVEGNRVVRPRVRPTAEGAIFTCRGNWNVIEGLELAGWRDSEMRGAIGIAQYCDNLTVRDCHLYCFDFKAIVGSPDAGSITIEFCEFDSCGTVNVLSGKTVDVWSWKPEAVVRVEHCYFHDALSQCHLKTHAPRNIIRYNWFENAYSESVNVTDRIATYCPGRPEGAYPMHSDIVGNVFVQGFSPGPRYSSLSTGGHGVSESGPEGDLSVAHNLFVMNVFGRGENASVFDLVQGNVDHVRMYSNVFLQIGGPPCLVYLHDLTWDTPETKAFVKRRGSPDPIVEGSNNWIFERSAGVPETFKNTLRGLNPKFVDLLNGDFHPRKDSPLTGAGLWPLPKGRVVDLFPEYEPQRGIPVDLKPKPRRKVVPPSIGPFEAAQ